MTVAVRRLHADGLWHGVGHSSMVERAEQTPLAIHAQIARRPYGGSSHVAQEDRILGGKVTDALGEVLGVDRGLARFTHRTVVEFLANFAEMVERYFQMAAFMLYEIGRQGLQSRAYIADEADIYLGTSADLFATKVHLDHTNAFRVELRVGKVGTKHEEGVALLHGAIG